MTVGRHGTGDGDELPERGVGGRLHGLGCRVVRHRRLLRLDGSRGLGLGLRRGTGPLPGELHGSGGRVLPGGNVLRHAGGVLVGGGGCVRGLREGLCLGVRGLRGVLGRGLRLRGQGRVAGVVRGVGRADRCRVAVRGVLPGAPRGVLAAGPGGVGLRQGTQLGAGQGGRVGLVEVLGAGRGRARLPGGRRVGGGAPVGEGADLAAAGAAGDGRAHVERAARWRGLGGLGGPDCGDVDGAAVPARALVGAASWFCGSCASVYGGCDSASGAWPVA
ncbi:hypothetical protein ACFQVA_05170 [Actinomadura keratinilytica]